MSACNRGFIHREQIGSIPHGTTVLQHLTRTFPTADWNHRLDAGEVFLNDRLVKGSELLRSGQRLAWHRPPWTEPEVPLSYDVLVEDADLLAVSKPSGLPTMPGGDFLEHTLLHLIRQRFTEADPLHRLGRGTSGVVLFALSDIGRTLHEAFRRHEIRKVYRALITGVPSEDAFTIRTPIGLVPHPLVGEVYAATLSGKPATSHVRVLDRRSAESLAEVEIETGRPHQIRIHLAAVGHPLVDDPLYLAGGLARDTAVPSDLGYHLHALSLEFVHPRDGRCVRICSSPPSVLVTVADTEGSLPCDTRSSQPS